MKAFAQQMIFNVAVMLGGMVLLAQPAPADQIPAGWAADNMQPIGYSDLDGRGGAFKLAIKEVNGRWYLYMGHLWHRGWSIVDVTDPKNPKFIKFIPGLDNTRSAQVDLHGNIMITGLEPIDPGWGGDPKKPSDEGVLIWDISDPVNPKQVAHWKTGGAGTHRNGYPGGKYAYLSADMPGFDGKILMVLDISDPAHPKEATRWWMPGQNKSAGEHATRRVTYHGPPIIDGNTAYLGYGPEIVILDFSDFLKPKMIGHLNMSPPFRGPVHGVLPIPGKSLLFANSEARSEVCEDELNFAALIDIKDPSKPRLMSLFPVPVPPKNAPYADFCDKGGRFGPHNTNHHYHSPDVEKQGDLVYLTYFNAGLRIFDIHDPRMPREVGWFVPPAPAKRLGPMPETKLVNQTEDVLVDRRGNIYITDKQWGLFVLRYTGTRPPSAVASNSRARQ